MTQQSIAPSTALEIAQKWLDTSAFTATNKQFDAHFNLISKHVRVTGVEGFESVSYDDWARQSKQEFEDNVLKSVHYKGLKLLATNERQIMFKTVESIRANDGNHKAHGVEILLEIEADGVWRAKQERVLSDNESRHDGLM
jgi:hypothetical protein